MFLPVGKILALILGRIQKSVQGVLHNYGKVLLLEFHVWVGLGMKWTCETISEKP